MKSGVADRDGSGKKTDPKLEGAARGRVRILETPAQRKERGSVINEDDVSG